MGLHLSVHHCCSTVAVHALLGACWSVTFIHTFQARDLDANSGWFTCQTAPKAGFLSSVDDPSSFVCSLVSTVSQAALRVVYRSLSLPVSQAEHKKLFTDGRPWYSVRKMPTVGCHSRFFTSVQAH